MLTKKLQGLQQLVCLETVPWYHLCLSSFSQISLLPSCREKKRSWEWQGAWAGGEQSAKSSSRVRPMPRLSASLFPSCFDGQKVISSNDLMVRSHWNLHPQRMLCLQIYYQTKRLGDCLLARRVGARTRLPWSPLHHTVHWNIPWFTSCSSLSTACGVLLDTDQSCRGKC